MQQIQKFTGVPHMSRSIQAWGQVREVIVGKNFKTVTNGLQGWIVYKPKRPDRTSYILVVISSRTPPVQPFPWMADQKRIRRSQGIWGPTALLPLWHDISHPFSIGRGSKGQRSNMKEETFTWRRLSSKKDCLNQPCFRGWKKFQGLQALTVTSFLKIFFWGILLF